MSAESGDRLSWLEAALARLDEALAEPENEYLRDACIQRFEFTFELLWKALKTYAEESGVRVFSPKDSLRTSFQLGLLDDDRRWLKMLEDRNLSTHTYSEAEAREIYSRLATYATMIRVAVDRLRERRQRG